MQPNNRRLLIAAGITITTFFLLGATRSEPNRQDSPAFPDGYRSWMHIASATITAGPRGPGMHHIYANAKGVQGYRTGNYADGAIIVFDRFNIQTVGTSTKISTRQVVDVMTRDSQRYKETGGWGFDEFAGDSKTTHAFDQSKAVTACFTCHTQRKDQGYVFTSIADVDRTSP